MRGIFDKKTAHIRVLTRKSQNLVRPGHTFQMRLFSVNGFENVLLRNFVDFDGIALVRTKRENEIRAQLRCVLEAYFTNYIRKS